MLRTLVVLLALAPGVAVAFESEHREADLPRVLAGRDPSDSSARVPPAHYESVTAAIKTYRPVEPLPWDELNRRVTPRPSKEEPPSAVPGHH